MASNINPGMDMGLYGFPGREFILCECIPEGLEVGWYAMEFCCTDERDGSNYDYHSRSGMTPCATKEEALRKALEFLRSEGK